MKLDNPKLPILVRECSGIEPQLTARYGLLFLYFTGNILFCINFMSDNVLVLSLN